MASPRDDQATPSGTTSAVAENFCRSAANPDDCSLPVFDRGQLSHVYNEHASVVKFIERTWKLKGTLSERSRDNLPNPIQDRDNAYVPRNMPAIGDLFDLFDFGRHQDSEDR